VTRPLTLTDAGMETVLIFEQGIDLPCFAAFPLVETEDGRSLRHREAVNRGCADRPLSNDEVVAKFLDNAERAVARGTAERVAEAVLNLDRQNAGALADVLCAGR